MNLLNRIKAFFIPSVDTIVADFSKAEARLRALADKLDAAVNKAEAKAHVELAKAKAHADHSIRATAVANRIKNLIL